MTQSQPPVPSQPARPGQEAQAQASGVRAPAPSPPSRLEHPIPVCTADLLPGHSITHIVGEVMGIVVRDRVPGGNREIQARTLLGERQLAVARMCEMALRHEAHAVIGVRFETVSLSDDVTEVCAYGTAVQLGSKSCQPKAQPSPGAMTQSSPGVDMPRPSASHPMA